MIRHAQCVTLLRNAKVVNVDLTEHQNVFSVDRCSDKTELITKLTGGRVNDED